MSRGDRRPAPSIEGLISVKVDNLSYNTSANDLRRMFDKYGDIGDVHIPRDKYSKQSKGFGFVRFHRKSDADYAAERCDGKYVDGRELRVTVAKYDRPPPSDRRRSRSPRGGYGRGGGRRSRSPRRYSPRRRSRSPRRRRSRTRSPPGRSPSPRQRSRSQSRSPPPSRSPSRSPSPKRKQDDRSSQSSRNDSPSPRRESRSASRSRSPSRSP